MERQGSKGIRDLKKKYSLFVLYLFCICSIFESACLFRLQSVFYISIGVLDYLSASPADVFVLHLTHRHTVEEYGYPQGIRNFFAVKYHARHDTLQP